MMLTWQKVDAIPGWFGAHSYALWRSLLDFQAENVRGNLFEIGVWRGRSASLLASYRKGQEKLYLCDLRLDEEAVNRSIPKPWFLSGGLKPDNVAAVVKQFKPPMVDVCSGVERTPTRKDYDAMKAFIQNVRSVK